MFALYTDYKISLRTDFFFESNFIRNKNSKEYFRKQQKIIQKDPLLTIVFIEISSSFEVSNKSTALAK